MFHFQNLLSTGVCLRGICAYIVESYWNYASVTRANCFWNLFQHDHLTGCAPWRNSLLKWFFDTIEVFIVKLEGEHCNNRLIIWSEIYLQYVKCSFCICILGLVYHLVKSLSSLCWSHFMSTSMEPLSSGIFDHRVPFSENQFHSNHQSSCRCYFKFNLYRNQAQN